MSKKLNDILADGTHAELARWVIAYLKHDRVAVKVVLWFCDTLGHDLLPDIAVTLHNTRMSPELLLRIAQRAQLPDVAWGVVCWKRYCAKDRTDSGMATLTEWLNAENDVKKAEVSGRMRDELKHAKIALIAQASLQEKLQQFYSGPLGQPHVPKSEADPEQN